MKLLRRFWLWITRSREEPQPELTETLNRAARRATRAARVPRPAGKAPLIWRADDNA